MAEDGEGLKLLIEVYRVNYAWASLTLGEKRRKKRCGGHVTNECAAVEITGRNHIHKLHSACFDILPLFSDSLYLDDM